MIRSSASVAAVPVANAFGVEIAGRQRGEDRVVESDRVDARFEVGDRVDIAAAERGGEGERVGAAEPDQQVSAAFAVEHVAAEIADQPLAAAELVAGDVDIVVGQLPDGRNGFDLGAGVQHIVDAGVDGVCSAVAGCRFDDRFAAVADIISVVAAKAA